jgi:hypothetical protein
MLLTMIHRILVIAVENFVPASTGATVREESPEA